MPIDILKQIWPEWSLGKRIGGGAYGTVYEASRNEYGVENHAAIKTISIPASEAEIDTLRSEGLDMQATKTHFQTIVNDFVNEIRLMVSLDGRPNIVNVKDYKVVEKKGEFGWHIFILMELLTPFAVYTCDHQMTEAEVIKLGCDICTAIETCADERIIHRDIKPGNILVHKSGDFKLGDFGIARKLENMTGGLSQRYTPKYMAPEVATSMYYDERVDIYSLGIVLYELLNGRRIPFQPNRQINSLADIENAVRRRNSGEALPAPSNASPAMADLILRACAYDPNMRFASATEMKQALMSVANSTYQIAASNLDRTTSVRKAADSYDRTTSVRKAPAASNQKSAPAVNTFGSVPKRKNKMPAVIATVLAVVLLVGAGIFVVPKLVGNNDSGDPNDQSSEQKEIQWYIDEAEKLADSGDYAAALEKIQDGLSTYPDSSELQNRSVEYAAMVEDENDSTVGDADETGSTPPESTGPEVLPSTVSLSTLPPANHAGCPNWNTGSSRDPFGNDYSTKSNYITFDSRNGMEWESSFHTYNAYAEYYVDGKFKSVSGVLAPNSNTKEGATAYLQIYADDLLIFTSPYVTRKTEPFDFSVDISGAKYLKLCITLENDGSNYWFGEHDFYSSLILSDVTLKLGDGNVSSTTSLGTSLDSLGEFNKTAWPKWNDGYPKDLPNTDYSSACNYVIFEPSRDMEFKGADHTYYASAEYRVNKEYSSLSGTIAPYTSANIDSTAYVNIYADDTLVYTSPCIEGKSDAISFDVDISNASYVSIEVVLYNDGSYYWFGAYPHYSALILSNLLLTA